MVKLSGLWKPKNEGKIVLSGKLGFNGVFLIMKNEYKEKENDPDYILWLKEDEKPQQVNEISI